MSDFYIPPLPDDFTDKVMERIEEEKRRRNKMQHPKVKKQRK